MRGSGVQREVLASLALVMVSANGLLAAVLLRAVDAHLEQQRDLMTGALLTESRRAPEELEAASALGREWRIVRAAPAALAAQPEETAAIANAVHERGEALLWSGRPWEPLLFAAERPEPGRIAVLRVEPVVPGLGLVGLIAGNAVVFFGAGAYLLRRSLIVPLQQLASAVREMGEGTFGARVQARGAVAEVEQLGTAFDEMAEALASRTDELEKVVVDLRTSNEDLRRAREGLDRAERLAAVGTLAAGVAHEVGNPMGAVLAFLDLARREARAEGFSERGLELLEKASREGDRVRTILRQLLDFSRPAPVTLDTVDLAGVAEQAAALVRAQAPYRSIAIEVESEPGVGLAWAAEGATVQILLNLVLNAAQSVAASRGERIRIRIAAARAGALPATVRHGDDDARAARLRADSGAVACHVEDDGPGIPEAERARVFDPFFTTKAPGEGTGLGLANALRLAEEQGGGIEIADSEALGGAQVSLLLPRAGAGQGAATRAS